jgi:hypothetical protein
MHVNGLCALIVSLAAGFLLVADASGDAWQEVSKLAAVIAEGESEFGFSVSVSGDLAAVGQPRRSNGGTAYIFRWEDASWLQEAVLVGHDTDPNDQFGWSVAIDGDFVVVGAPAAGDPPAGSAYVYRREGGSWIEEARLDALPGPALSVQAFGVSVGISGATVVVGAHETTVGNRDEAGAAYVFMRQDSVWPQVAELIASDANRMDYFGSSVGVDGDVLVVGAPYSTVTGAAYVFRPAEETWIEVAKLFAGDGAPLDEFGTSVAIDVDTVVVGAPWDIHAGGVGAGSAYVFWCDGLDWFEQAKLVAGDAADLDWFGLSVSISGNAVVVGSPNEDDAGQDAGAAYVFRLEDSTWSEEAKLVADGVPDFAQSGYAVAVDGPALLLGAPGENAATGSAYTFVGGPDCNNNTVVDALDIANGTSQDCNENGIPDECDIDDGTSEDFNGNGIPDECECLGDLTGDDYIGLDDLAQMLGNYGMASGATYEDGDLDSDGDVDLTDLAAMLGVFDTHCD